MIGMGSLPTSRACLSWNVYVSRSPLALLDLFFVSIRAHPKEGSLQGSYYAVVSPLSTSFPARVAW